MLNAFYLIISSCCLIITTAFPVSGNPCNGLDSSHSGNDQIIDTGASYPYALIAGGSKGIGYGVAEALAKRKFNLHVKQM